MPAKSASEVGVTMPHPSRKRIGGKPATKLDRIDPSESSSTSLPAESAQRNETHGVGHRQLEVLAAGARWPGRSRAAVMAWTA